jgi:gluconate 2-dehydrogenase gamma chain
MRNDKYQPGSVTALLNTDLVTTETRGVLKERLQREAVTNPSFFDKESFITLRAVCNRLIPQPTWEKTVDVAGCLDSILKEGKGDGWRYDKMPPDDNAYTKGLYGVDETSKIIFGAAFKLLDLPSQDNVLTSIQNNTAPGKTWNVIAANLFFEELLAQVVEIYYSHPYAKEDIGEVAMADAKGWTKIGLNELEAHEPKVLNEKIDVI